MDAAPTVFAALGAGVLSVVSPAVVPLLPGLVGASWNRGTAHAGAVLLGFSIVFVALGASATAVGQALLEHLTLCERLAGAFLVLLGLRDIGALKLGGHSLIASIAAGAALAFGWTPLAGVVLNQILAIATSAEMIDRGVALLTLYAAGRALALTGLALLIGTFLRRPVDAGAPRARIQLIAGAAMAFTGALIFAGLFPRIAAALVPFLPVA